VRELNLPLISRRDLYLGDGKEQHRDVIPGLLSDLVLILSYNTTDVKADVVKRYEKGGTTTGRQREERVRMPPV